MLGKSNLQQHLKISKESVIYEIAGKLESIEDIFIRICVIEVDAQGLLYWR